MYQCLDPKPYFVALEESIIPTLGKNTRARSCVQNKFDQGAVQNRANSAYEKSFFIYFHQNLTHPNEVAFSLEIILEIYY